MNGVTEEGHVWELATQKGVLILVLNGTTYFKAKVSSFAPLVTCGILFLLIQERT
jgi:hypothetical protein